MENVLVTFPRNSILLDTTTEMFHYKRTKQFLDLKRNSRPFSTVVKVKRNSRTFSTVVKMKRNSRMFNSGERKNLLETN